MEEFVPFASRSYGLMFLLLAGARGMDFLSTWVATPNLVLEGNPIARRLGWKWGIPVNLGLCFGFAFWPLPAIVISTTSVLVAARNFQSAWLMRTLGEYQYREWHLERVRETRMILYLVCLFGQVLLIGGVGAAVIYFSGGQLVPLAIGLGIVAYVLAVAFYSLLGDGLGGSSWLTGLRPGVTCGYLLQPSPWGPGRGASSSRPDLLCTLPHWMSF